MSYDQRNSGSYDPTNYAPARHSGSQPVYSDQGYEDEYDDYDDIDDEYPEPRGGSGYVGDAETMLRRAVDIIATAPTMPLSSSPANRP